MNPPTAVPRHGLLAAATGVRLVAADHRTASAAAQLRRHTENHAHRPPGIAPYGPLAATSRTGLMAPDHRTASAQLRTRRRAIGIHLCASIEQPPARAASTGIRRIT
ncbi:hypothetical protein AB0N07_14560 [Streptomyces sp. NPDC051172]|uniref:hypothetical protein n=1 Tax=Streptomyces sp. NPDC051172 TaxID=3155796 RepID=UPI003428F218